MTPAPLTIKRLTVRDVLRVSVVEITPTGAVVTLGGKNGAGKSSVLNAIELALAGLRDAPPVPVRRGAERGEVIVDLGDIVVERSFTASGSDLVVRAKDGARYPKPQAMLDALFERMAFDPLAFARLDPRAQAEQLRRIVGLDLSALDAERERVFAERTDVNRDGKAVRARLDAVPCHEGAPEAEVSVADLSAELERRLGAQSANERVRHRRREAAAARELASANVARLERELARARETLATADQAHREALGAVDALVEPDVGETRAAIALAEASNRRARDNRTRAALAAEVEGLRGRSAALGERIAALDAARTARIAASPFPVPGLGFGEDGAVTLNGLPFAQAGMAEKIRVSVALGVAAHPRLRVFFVRDGSLLDDDNLRLVAELAQAAACQIWIEHAHATASDAIIIEDGTVRTRAE